MLGGLYRYWRIGEEPPEVRAAFANPDAYPPGVAAGDSSMVLAYLCELDRADAFHPDVVLLSVGLHDLKRDAQTAEYQVSLSAYGENVAAIIDWFARKGLNLVWINNGPIDERIHNSRSSQNRRYESDLDAYNEVAEAIVQEQGIPVLPLREFMIALGPLHRLLVDHIHYHDEVSRLQAAFIAGYLAKLAVV
jgi:lysophospholipase L1-like esterase